MVNRCVGFSGTHLYRADVLGPLRVSRPSRPIGVVGGLKQQWPHAQTQLVPFGQPEPCCETTTRIPVSWQHWNTKKTTIGKVLPCRKECFKHCSPTVKGERVGGRREIWRGQVPPALPRQPWILWWRDLILSLWFRGARKLIEYSDLPPVFLVAWPRCCVVPLHQTALNLHKSQPCKRLLSASPPSPPTSFPILIARKPLRKGLGGLASCRTWRKITIC